MPVDFLSLLLLGVASGATVCSVGCLTHLGPYLLGSASGFREGVFSTLSYLAGKFLVYSLWGGLAGWVGITFAIPQGGARLAGFVLVAAGLAIPFFNRRQCPGKVATLGNRSTLFSLGVVTSLMPCPPLLALLAGASGAGSILAGLGCGAAFGLGLLFSPLVVAGGFLGHLANRLRLEVGGLRNIFQGFAMLILVAMGLRLLLEG